MKIELTPDQEDEIVEQWLKNIVDNPGDLEDVADACAEVLRLNWFYKRETPL